MIWPAIGADLNAMAAPIIGAIHQQAANAHLPHFAQDDFPRPFHQSPSFAGSSHRSKSEPEQLPKTVLSSGNPMQKLKPARVKPAETKTAPKAAKDGLPFATGLKFEGEALFYVVRARGCVAQFTHRKAFCGLWRVNEWRLPVG
jgi:hypothetical protein